MTQPMRRRKRNESKINVKLFIALVPAIIATVVLVNLLLSMQRGNEQEYINNIEEILQQSRIITQEYSKWFSLWENGTLTDTEIIDITNKNINDINGLINRLESITPPTKLKNAHEFVILSLRYEKESSENILKYIESRDKQYLDKSDKLFQTSFEYEGKAFTEFSKLGVGSSNTSTIRILP